jgi:hypothetical protein
MRTDCQWRDLPAIFSAEGHMLLSSALKPVVQDDLNEALSKDKNL